MLAKIRTQYVLRITHTHTHIRNNAIIKFCNMHSKCENRSYGICILVFITERSTSAGTCKKPFVAIIDGITMGGVSQILLWQYPVPCFNEGVCVSIDLSCVHGIFIAYYVPALICALGNVIVPFTAVGSRAVCPRSVPCRHRENTLCHARNLHR